MRSSPLVDIRVSLQELSPDTIISRMRVHEPSFQNDWFQVFVYISDNTFFVLTNFLKLEMLRKMNNLRAIESEWRE